MKQISFLINCSKNTRDHLELLLRSLHANLDGKQHEVIVFIDSDNENTHAYLRTIKSSFYDLKIVTHSIPPCVGYARNNNILVDLAKHDVCAYIQSDMVIGPHYDTYMLSELSENMILSATRVEPPLHGYSDRTITYDFGTDPTEFDMEKWNSYSNIVKTSETADYFFAPIMFYKKTWQDLGGYDTLFRRSREDSDLVQRALQLGIPMKQTWEANVYHFTCVSSRGKKWFDRQDEHAQERNLLQQYADHVELRRFIRKWGSFNHGEKLLTKFDIDLEIKTSYRESDIEIIKLVEPYVSRVWIDDAQLRDACVASTQDDHKLANSLLGFRNEEWEFASKFYNQTDYESIYNSGTPESYNIKLYVDLKQDNTQLYQNLHLLHEMIKHYGVGNWEFVHAGLLIKELIVNNPSLKVENPYLDEALLTIE